MLGFVKIDKEKRVLGGEIHQERKRKQLIGYSILGGIIFMIFNLILYYLTKI